MSQPDSFIAPDVALVLEGGGMRAAHTAGVVASLIEHEVWLPYVCGLSAGSSNAINYIARDADRTRRCFVEIACDKRFGGFGSFVRHNGFFNSDFLYIEAIEDGTFGGGKVIEANIDNGGVYLGSYSDKVSADVQSKIEEYTEQIKADTLISDDEVEAIRNGL